MSVGACVGDVIAPARIADNRTVAGRYVNHSKSPNCEYVKWPDGDIYLVAKTNIQGAKGGEPGDELTVDYRQALNVAGRLERTK
jgi:SET domain-containing protein